MGNKYKKNRNKTDQKRELDMKQIILFMMMIVAFMVLLPPCQGIIEKEYEYEAKDLVHNDILYSFRVKLVVETEQNDVWIKGKTYTITFILFVESVDFDYVDSLNFSSWNIYTDHEYVYISTSGWIAYLNYGSGGERYSYPITVTEFRVCSTREGRVEIFPETDITAYKGGNIIWSKHWRAEEPLYIDVTTKTISSQIDEIKTLIYFLILTTIILIIANIYFGLKHPK